MCAAAIALSKFYAWNKFSRSIVGSHPHSERESIDFDCGENVNSSIRKLAAMRNDFLFRIYKQFAVSLDGYFGI